MNTSRSAAIVRRWVAFYTVGLPPDIRDARRAEIEDDLWNQGHDVEAEESAGDVLDRLVFGMWADVTWRLEQRHRSRVRPVLRSVTMGTRVVAASSIIAGLTSAVFIVLYEGFGSWVVLLGFTASGALAIALWGLVGVFNERIGRGAAVVGAVGGLGAAMAAVGVIPAFILLPIGSAAVVLDLARHGLMGRTLAIAHAVTALVWLVVGLLVSANPSIGAAVWLVVLYPLSWIGIGVGLLRGQPVLDGPVPSGNPA